MTDQDNKVFWRELWDFVSSQEPIFTKTLVKDLYELGINIEKNEVRGDPAYFCLCWNAFVVAKALKKQLPHNLHARMILGEQNEKTKKYVQFCSKLTT